MFLKTSCVFPYLLYLVAVFSNAHGLSDDKYLKTCDRNSLEVNKCLIKSIQEGLQVMSDGIKALGVPPIDPYHQKELRVEYKRKQIMVKMLMKDIYVEGLRSAKVHDVRWESDQFQADGASAKRDFLHHPLMGGNQTHVTLVIQSDMPVSSRCFPSPLNADEDKFYMEVDLTSPKVFVQGLYHGEGSYNGLQILATGEFNTTMTDLTYTWKLGGTPEKINNETYVRINSFYMRPDVGSLKSYLSNDNPEAQEFITLGLNFANANWRLFYKELLPYAQAYWNKIGVRVANKIFLKIPYEQLFPAKS